MFLVIFHFGIFLGRFLSHVLGRSKVPIVLFLDMNRLEHRSLVYICICPHAERLRTLGAYAERLLRLRRSRKAVTVCFCQWPCRATARRGAARRGEANRLTRANSVRSSHEQCCISFNNK